MFNRRKKIGYDQLSKEEKKLARKLRKKTSRNRVAFGFIRHHETNAFQYYLDNYEFSYGDSHKEMILESIRQNNLLALKAIADTKGLIPCRGRSFFSGGYLEDSLCESVMSVLLSEKTPTTHMLDIILDAFQEEERVMALNDIVLRHIVEKGWIDGLGVCLKYDTPQKDTFYDKALSLSAKAPIEMMGRILSNGREDITDKTLTSVLSKVIANKKIEPKASRIKSIDTLKVKLLLSHNAPANIEMRDMVKLCMESDVLAFDLLVKHGLDVAKYVPYLLDVLHKDDPASWMISHLEKISIPVQKIDDKNHGYDLLSPEKLRHIEFVSDEVKLTTIFNFQMREETKVTENVRTGQMALAIRNLDDLSREALAFVEATFKDKNGDTSLLSTKPDFKNQMPLLPKKSMRK